MPESDSTKACTKCGKVQPIGRFPKDWNSKSGRKGTCKDCYAAYAREYRTRMRPEAKAKAGERRRAIYHGRLKTSAEFKERMKRNARRWHEKSPRLNIHMAVRHGIKRRPAVNPITTDYMMGVWEQQKGICAVSGVPMTWGKGKLMPTSVSLDRIDQTKGYEIGNVRLVCYQANTFRGRWSDEQMLAMAKAIVANLEPAEPVVGLLSLFA
jgi:hypothetical protein